MSLADEQTTASVEPSPRSRRHRALAAVRGIPSAARTHWLFTLLLVLGLVLRLLAIVGFPPIMWFNDGFEYLGVALRLHPYAIRADGYSAFLRALLPFHSFALVSTLQHLMGLAVAAMFYVLLRRWRAPRWLAALAVAPQLLDAHQIALEHLLLSDTLFLFLVTVAAVLLLTRERPTAVQAGAAGLVMGLATLTRTVGLPLLVLYVVYVLVRHTSWRAVVACTLLALAPLGAYASWYDSAHGTIALNSADGVFLYSRVMAFADCTKFSVPASVASLCDPLPPSQRPASQNYIWHESPLEPPSGTVVAEDRFGRETNARAQKFARAAIFGQPLSYLHVGFRDFARTFGWTRTAFPNATDIHDYSFTTTPKQAVDWVVVTGATNKQDVRQYDRAGVKPRVVRPFATVLMAYQHGGYLPGTLLGVILLVPFGALAASRARDARWWLVGFLWVTSLALLLVPPFTAEFDYRYVLPAMPFACAAAALAVAIAMTRRSVAKQA